MGQKQTGQRVQIGRTIVTLPDMAAGAFRAGVDRRGEQQAADRAKDARIAEQAAEIERFKFDNNLGAIALKVIKEMKLRPLDAEKLGNTLNAQVEKHLKAGKPLRSFDPSPVISEFRSRLGRALPPAPKFGETSQALPPPAGEGHVAPADRAAHAAKAQDEKEKNERARRTRDQKEEDIQATYRRLGLTRPDVGYPGSGRSGLGY